MSFFVDNLHFYLHVDVVEPLFQHFIEQVQTSRVGCECFVCVNSVTLECQDFEKVQRAHERFVEELTGSTCSRKFLR